jgi:hypothetical protein
LPEVEDVLLSPLDEDRLPNFTLLTDVSRRKWSSSCSNGGDGDGDGEGAGDNPAGDGLSIVRVGRGDSFDSSKRFIAAMLSGISPFLSCLRSRLLTTI